MYNEASVADLRMMFDGTLVRYDKEPVFIHRITEDREAECLFIGNQSHKYCNILDEKFDFTPVNTGYVNIRGHVAFFYRTSVRKYKQGLSPECMVVKVNGDDFDNAETFHYVAHQVKGLRDKALYNTVKNIYPKFTEVLASFEDKVMVGAFDRQWAVSSGGRLFYRSRQVATVDLNSGKITFRKGKEYLQEALGKNYEGN